MHFTFGVLCYSGGPFITIGAIGFKVSFGFFVVLGVFIVLKSAKTLWPTIVPKRGGALVTLGSNLRMEVEAK